MRIGLLTASFDPVIGGAETYALNLAVGLYELGHEVLVVTDTPHGIAPSEPVERRRSFHVERLHTYRDRLFDRERLPWEEMAFGLLAELAATFDAFSPDVVVSNSLDTAIQAAMMRRATGVSWAAAFHEHAPQDEPYGRGRLAVVYGDLRPHAVLAGSEFYAARAREFGPVEAVHVVHHGVPMSPHDPRLRDEWRSRYGFSPEHTVVVCVGRLKERKGIRELVDAFATVHPRERGLRLVVAGTVSSASSAYYDLLQQRRAEAGLEDLIVFDETVVADQIPGLMAAADIVAQPSYEEGLGLAVLEGMAARRPVLTTHAPGIDEIVTEAGLAVQVPPRDTAALAAALDGLVRDGKLRELIAGRGYDHARRNFSLEVMARRTADVLGAL